MAICGAYAGFWTGFHGMGLAYSIGAAGSGVQSAWGPSLAMIGGGATLGTLGFAMGALTAPVLYGKANLLMVAFPPLKQLENRWFPHDKTMFPKHIIRRSSLATAAVLFVFDLAYLQAMGLCIAVPGYLYLWQKESRK